MCLPDFEECFSHSLDKSACDYFSAGAGHEQTLKDNVEAFNRFVTPHSIASYRPLSSKIQLLAKALCQQSFCSKNTFSYLPTEIIEQENLDLFTDKLLHYYRLISHCS